MQIGENCPFASNMGIISVERGIPYSLENALSGTQLLSVFLGFPLADTLGTKKS